VQVRSWLRAAVGNRRLAARVLGVAVLAGVLLGAGGALLTPHHSGSGQSGSSAVDTVPVGADQAAAAAAPRSAITQLQVRLNRLPKDWMSWSSLGLAYLEQARATADPNQYPLAEQAFQKSLAVHPATDNAPALTGLGALAAAKHDFAGALQYGQSAVKADSYLAAAYGVVVDSLVELGRYPEAWAAVQQMIDIRPDTSSYARTSYSFELRGDVPKARSFMEQALAVAPGATEIAFARYHLATLAFDNGDLTTAAEQVDLGLKQSPDDPALRSARAKISAARGDVAGAIADLRGVVARLPLPAYVSDLGDLLESTGDKIGAQQQFDLVQATEALQRGQGIDVDTEMAVFDADHGDKAAALQSATAAYGKRQSVTVADALGWALHANGRDVDALRYADQALRLGTRSAQMYYHRGMIRAALGQNTGARADLTEALRINPYFSVRHVPIAKATLAHLGGGK
jgi:tetratricopeptide (TPR) repeat protein